jgi:D-hydroxyproline dehydrogenase subunit beta
VQVCLIDRGDISSGTTGLGEGNVLCSDKAPGAEVELAVEGLALFDEIEDLLGDSAGIRRKGALVVHVDDGSWAREPERLGRLQAAGVECSLMTPDEAREAEPELRGELLGASWFPRDLQCAPRAITRGLAREAEGLGAAVTTGCEVHAIAVDGGRVEGLVTAAGWIAADAVVLAAGAWSGQLARSTGLELPVEPRKGQLVRLERRPGFVRRKVIDGGYMAAVATPDAGLHVSTVIETTLDGHVLVGSTRERRGFDLTVDAAVTDELLRRAALFAPGVANLAVDAAWSGLRPWLPGGLPAIGRTAAADGLWIATGHEGAGVAHGPITGRLVAQAICGEPTEIGLEPFQPDRFGSRYLG